MQMAGDVEEAILETYLSGISVRKIAGLTGALSKLRIGKDAVGRIASRSKSSRKNGKGARLRRRATPISI